MGETARRTAEPLSAPELSERPRIRPEILALLPDTSTPEFAAEAERQSRLIAESPQDAEDQAFLDSASVFFDDEEP